MSDMVKKKIKIEGLRCPSCAMTIDFDLEDLKGVKTARTSYARGECEVEYDKNRISLADIISQVQKSGYDACEEK